ncbi:MAG: hypothetical protein ACAI25_09200 [Planctomycetota bacterium]
MIESLVEQGWAEHEKDSAGVLARCEGAIPEVTEAKHLPGLAALLVHVAGEHLGEWKRGLSALDRMMSLPVVKAGTAEAQALLRSRATLLLASGDRATADEVIARAQTAGLPVASTRIRVLAVAASALAGQKQVEAGVALFEEALSLAAYGPDKADPAARALAVTGNNLACSLEEKKVRTPAEDRLLELAARTGRRFWEVAGTWIEVERAEYRLAMTCLALGRAKDAVTHANECLALCEKNGADAGELFFANEALARAHKARMVELLAEVDAGIRPWCEETLKKLG